MQLAKVKNKMEKKYKYILLKIYIIKIHLYKQNICIKIYI